MRQAARRNTFTGKTYNSLENISQFFGERGMPFNAADSRRRSRIGAAAVPRPAAASQAAARGAARRRRRGARRA